jgi:hypothetical protein
LTLWADSDTDSVRLDAPSHGLRLSASSTPGALGLELDAAGRLRHRFDATGELDTVDGLGASGGFGVDTSTSGLRLDASAGGLGLGALGVLGVGASADGLGLDVSADGLGLGVSGGLRVDALAVGLGVDTSTSGLRLGALGVLGVGASAVGLGLDVSADGLGLGVSSGL